MGKVRENLLYAWKNNPNDTLEAGLASFGISGHIDDDELSIGVGSVDIEPISEQESEQTAPDPIQEPEDLEVDEYIDDEDYEDSEED